MKWMQDLLSANTCLFSWHAKYNISVTEYRAVREWIMYSASCVRFHLHTLLQRNLHMQHEYLLPVVSLAFNYLEFGFVSGRNFQLLPEPPHTVHNDFILFKFDKSTKLILRRPRSSSYETACCHFTMPF